MLPTSPRQVVAIALSVTKVSHNRNWDPVEKRPRQPYVKLPLWWLGIILTASGEVGNLIAYGFAPAAIVAPVGSVGVLMNGFLATCCLKEPLRKRDVVGMISIVAGVVLLVLGVPQTTVRARPSPDKVAGQRAPPAPWPTANPCTRRSLSPTTSSHMKCYPMCAAGGI